MTDRTTVIEAVHVTQVGGIVAYAGLGGYHASEGALEGLSESLPKEVAEFGIPITVIPPGGLAPELGNSSTTADSRPGYARLHGARSRRAGSAAPTSAGFRSAILQIVESDEPALRVPFGQRQPTSAVPQVYQDRLDGWAEWTAVSRDAGA